MCLVEVIGEHTRFQDKVEERKLMKIMKLYRSIPADASQPCLYIFSLLGLRLCRCDASRL